MSTGMSDTSSIVPAIAIAKEQGCSAAIFQCTSEYPCPPAKLNLAAIQSLEAKFNLPVGFSDHSIGTDMAFLSVAAGARLIEKHVSFDKTRPSFDHSISLEVKQFGEMVKRIRLAETALGTGRKILERDIIRQAKKFQRRLAAAKDLPAGHILALNDLLFMRFKSETPFIGAEQTRNIIGKATIKPLLQHQGISWSDIE